MTATSALLGILVVENSFLGMTLLLIFTTTNGKVYFMRLSNALTVSPSTHATDLPLTIMLMNCHLESTQAQDLLPNLPLMPPVGQSKYRHHLNMPVRHNISEGFPSE